MERGAISRLFTCILHGASLGAGNASFPGTHSGEKTFPMPGTAACMLQNLYQRRKILKWECVEEIGLSTAPV